MTAPHNEIDQLPVSGSRIVEAQSRLDYVSSLIHRRLAALGSDPCIVPDRYVGPATRVDAENVRGLLGDKVCAAHLGRIARHGGRAGVVLVLHGTAHEVAEAVASGTSLAAALIEGRHVRLAPPAAPRPPIGRPVPGDIGAAVLQGDAAAAGRILADLVTEAGDSAEARREVGAELRRVGDVLDPRDDDIACPLCLASPRLRPSEVEAHLVSTHAALAQGAQ